MAGAEARTGRRVVLHVGAMKSGTTSLQSLLFANQGELAKRGVLVPGENWLAQIRGVLDVIATRDASGPHWSALVRQVQEWDGVSVISMEYLGPFIPARVRAVANSFPGTRVEVVVTARDLNRTLASMWQEVVQNGRSWEWHDYLRAARRQRPRPGRRRRRVTPPGRTFWRQQDLLRITSRWAKAVDEVTLVTVPAAGAGPDELTRRFGRVVGFDPAGLAEGAERNSSIGAASARLLQLVNGRLAEQGVAAEAGKPIRKDILAKQVLAARAAQEPRIGLDVARWVRRHAAQMVEGLASSGIRLEGEWSDLTPVPVRGVDPTRTRPAAIVEAATDGFHGLREALTERGLTGLPAWEAPTSRDHAVRQLATLVHQALLADPAR